MAGETGRAAALARFGERTRLGADEVAEMRGFVFSDGIVTRAEAEALIAIDRRAAERSREWTAFIVEALADYLVHQERPSGYVSEDNALWLAALLDGDNSDPATRIEVLIGVLERAKSAPPALAAHALRVVADAVVAGDQRLSCGSALVPGVLGRAEVSLVRRVLHAFGGTGGIGISRAEAEALFELNDRTVEARNHPEWTELFVKAIANFVMCASGYAPPSREEALRQDAFLDDTDVDVGSFFRRMAAGGFGGILSAYRRDDSLEGIMAAKNALREAEAAEAEKIDAAEAAWLVDRIGRDGTVHANERALLEFIRRESPSVHPAITDLAAKVA